MIDEVKELVKEVSSPADMAVVLLAGTAGFVVDAGLNVIGFLSPGVVGVTSATGALGVKRSVDAWWQRRKALRIDAWESNNVRQRAERLLGWLTENGTATHATDSLVRELGLHAQGVTTDEDLLDALDDALDSVRSTGPDGSTRSLGGGGARTRRGGGIRRGIGRSREQ